MLLVGIVAGGIVLGMSLYRHMPEEAVPSGPPDTAAAVPAGAETADTGGGNRLFCAESSETGRCSCITSAGQRPDIPEDECRRRARRSDTDR